MPHLETPMMCAYGRQHMPETGDDVTALELHLQQGLVNRASKEGGRREAPSERREAAARATMASAGLVRWVRAGKWAAVGLCEEGGLRRANRQRVPKSSSGYTA